MWTQRCYSSTFVKQLNIPPKCFFDVTTTDALFSCKRMWLTHIRIKPIIKTRERHWGGTKGPHCASPGVSSWAYYQYRHCAGRHANNRLDGEGLVWSTADLHGVQRWISPHESPQRHTEQGRACELESKCSRLLNATYSVRAYILFAGAIHKRNVKNR